MNRKGKGLMFGPSMPLDLIKTTGPKSEVAKADMNAMTDLVRALKDVDVSPEKIDQNKHSGTGTITGKQLNLGEDNPNVELG